MFSINSKQLRYTVFSTGLLGMALRWLLYATGIDQKGLLISNHWSAWSILILTALILGLVLIATRKPTVPSGHLLLQSIGSLAAAAGIFVRSVTRYLAAGNIADRLPEILGIAAALGLLAAGICHLLKAKTPFLGHSAVCLFFAMQMISHYRSWSADPQLMDYCFHLIAFLFLMLTGYFLAAQDVRMGKPSALTFCAMSAAYFCCVALPESGDAMLLIPCALWAITCGVRSNTAEEKTHANS